MTYIDKSTNLPIVGCVVLAWRVAKTPLEKSGLWRVYFLFLIPQGTSSFPFLFLLLLIHLFLCREDTKETIETALKMGVRVKMITGDQLAIAQETARRLGMGSEKMYFLTCFRFLLKLFISSDIRP